MSNYEIEFKREKIEDALDELTRAKGRLERAELNAGLCQTSWDRRKADEAEDAYYETRDRVIETLMNL